MPEFILPAEADHCPHCDAVLRDPPDCCEAMKAEYSREFMATLAAQDDEPLEIADEEGEPGEGRVPCPDCPPGQPDENCDDCGGDGWVPAPASAPVPAESLEAGDPEAADLLPAGAVPTDHVAALRALLEANGHTAACNAAWRASGGLSATLCIPECAEVRVELAQWEGPSRETSPASVSPAVAALVEAARSLAELVAKRTWAGYRAPGSALIAANEARLRVTAVEVALKPFAEAP
jgi:hypothetical protein